jgi:hypothetical protein
VKPTLWRIIDADHASMLSAIAPVVFAGMAIGSHWFPEYDPAFFLKLAAVATPLCLAVLTTRVRAVRRVFREGEPTRATVTNITKYRDRGRIEYAFELGGKVVETGHAVHFNRAVKDLQVGQRVTVYARRDEPGDAYVAEIFDVSSAPAFVGRP